MRMALAVASFRNAAVSAGFAARMAGKPLDDRAGRLEARSRGLALIGSAAVIGLAKTEGLIPAARPLLEQMIASGYFIGSAIVSSVLADVGEWRL